MVREYGAERRRIQITKMRGANFRGGYHDAEIPRGGLFVFPRIAVQDTSDSSIGEMIRVPYPRSTLYWARR